MSAAAPPPVPLPPASPLAWLRQCTPRSIAADSLAGLTLAAYMLPAAIGDASLAHLPPQAGLYACMCSGLVFWCLCSSRYTAITVTSAISLLMGTTLASLDDADPARFAALASCTAFFVAALAFAAWLIRAGSLVSFISESVLLGFKAGVALTLASTQLPKLLGISGAHGNFWACARFFLTNLGQISIPAASLGLAALAILALGKVFLKNQPVSLVVVIGGIVFAAAADLESKGVKMLGSVPQGLPAFGLPDVRWSDLNDLLPLALACFLLSAVETTAIGRMFAARYRSRLDANREFLALAAANLAAGIGRGYPVSGGMSQSLVNEGAGARSPISGLVAALLVLVVAVFCSGLLRTLPQPVLAAVVLMAVPSLIRLDALRHLWRADRQELAVALVALAGVLASGLLRGVLIGAVISIVLLIRRVSRPHVAFLGRIPGTRRYTDMLRHDDNQPVPGAIIFRPESSLLYFNADHVRDLVLTEVRKAAQPPRVVLGDLSASPYVDLAGAEMLKNLETELSEMGIHLRLVEALATVRDRLRLEGLEERVGRIDRFTTLADAVDHLDHLDHVDHVNGDRTTEPPAPPPHATSIPPQQ